VDLFFPDSIFRKIEVYGYGLSVKDHIISRLK